MTFDTAEDWKVAEIARINKMSLSELAEWITQALCGEITISIGNVDEPPFGAVHRVYKELDPAVRQTFMDIVIRFLGEIESSGAPHWQGRAADNLLLLTEVIFLTMPSEARELVVETIRRLVVPPFSPEVQDRALAVLVSLGHRAIPDFWYRAAAARPQERAVVAFHALSRINPEIAMAWATEQDAPLARREAIVLALPWLVEHVGASRVDGLLRDVWGVLDDRTKQDIALWSAPLGLRLVGLAPPSHEQIDGSTTTTPETATTPGDQPASLALHQGLDAWNPRTSADTTIALLQAWMERGDPRDRKLVALLEKLANEIVARRRRRAFLWSPEFQELYSSAIAKQRRTGASLDSVVDVALLQIEQRHIGDPQAHLELIISNSVQDQKKPGSQPRSRSRM